MDKKNTTLKIALGTAIAVILFMAGYIVYQQYGHEKVEIKSVPETTTQEVRKALPPKTSEATIRDTTHQIQRAKEVQVPKYQYYTATQEQSDKVAQNYAKKQKADTVVKNTTEKPVVNEKGEATGQTVIENDYYAINLERKHKVKAGAAVVDKDVYATVSYQNRDVEYTAYYCPERKAVGAGVEVTIAKW